MSAKRGSHVQAAVGMIDAEIAEINRLIALQQQKIDLLDQQRSELLPGSGGSSRGNSNSAYSSASKAHDGRLDSSIADQEAEPSEAGNLLSEHATIQIASQVADANLFFVKSASSTASVSQFEEIITAIDTAGVLHLFNAAGKEILTHDLHLTAAVTTSVAKVESTNTAVLIVGSADGAINRVDLKLTLDKPKAKGFADKQKQSKAIGKNRYLSPLSAISTVSRAVVTSTQRFTLPRENGQDLTSAVVYASTLHLQMRKAKKHFLYVGTSTGRLLQFALADEKLLGSVMLASELGEPVTASAMSAQHLAVATGSEVHFVLMRQLVKSAVVCNVTAPVQSIRFDDSDDWLLYARLEDGNIMTINSYGKSQASDGAHACDVATLEGLEAAGSGSGAASGADKTSETAEKKEKGRFGVFKRGRPISLTERPGLSAEMQETVQRASSDESFHRKLGSMNGFLLSVANCSVNILDLSKVQRDALTAAEHVGSYSLAGTGCTFGNWSAATAATASAMSSQSMPGSGSKTCASLRYSSDLLLDSALTPEVAKGKKRSIISRVMNGLRKTAHEQPQLLSAITAFNIYNTHEGTANTDYANSSMGVSRSGAGTGESVLMLLRPDADMQAAAYRKVNGLDGAAAGSDGEGSADGPGKKADGANAYQAIGLIFALVFLYFYYSSRKHARDAKRSYRGRGSGRRSFGKTSTDFDYEDRASSAAAGTGTGTGTGRGARGRGLGGGTAEGPSEEAMSSYLKAKGYSGDSLAKQKDSLSKLEAEIENITSRLNKTTKR